MVWNLSQTQNKSVTTGSVRLGERELYVTLCSETTPTDRSTVGSLVYVQV